MPKGMHHPKKRNPNHLSRLRNKYKKMFTSNPLHSFATSYPP